MSELGRGLHAVAAREHYVHVGALARGELRALAVGPAGLHGVLQLLPPPWPGLLWDFVSKNLM